MIFQDLGNMVFRAVSQTAKVLEFIVSYFATYIELKTTLWEKVKSHFHLTGIVPVRKNDSNFYYHNYRPISPLYNIEKILEKLMYKKFIYHLQFGFRQNFSTAHALVNLT